MGWRTVVISQRAKVEYAMGYMVVRRQETYRIFMDEVQTVLIATPAVSLTAVWLNECIRRKIKVIFCDERRNPAAEVLPYCGSHDSSRQIRSQIQWTQESKEKIWQYIVREKIYQQVCVLQDYAHREEAEMLLRYRDAVQPGDATNREGHAAKVYFNVLWGKEFSRRDDTITNDALNYGYAILLSACNREITASGYMTQLGIFHDNIFNSFNLGSDLMEVFRPLVDRTVLSAHLVELGTEEKKGLIQVLHQTVWMEEKQTLVSQAIGIYCRSVFRAMEESNPALISLYRVKL